MSSGLIFEVAVVLVGLIIGALWVIRLSRVHTEQRERQIDRRQRRQDRQRRYRDEEEDEGSASDYDARYRYVSGEYADAICH